jgi:hypothetical protein
VVTFKEGASLDPNQLAKAMDAAGFGADEITVIIKGSLTEEKGYPAFKVSGSNQIFLLAENEVLNQLKALGSGKEVTITAKVEMKGGGAPFTLILEKVESPTM